MKFFKLYCFTSLLLWTIPSSAQQYSLRQYASVDGLPQSQVTSIIEDKLGYLWVGTLGGGLARFDGKEFKVYNTFDGLISNIITGLLLDKEDHLWVCHPQGISKFEAGQFKKFVTPGSQTSEGKLRRIFLWRDSICYITMEGKWGSIYNDKLGNLKKVTTKNVWFIRPSPSKVIMTLSDSSFLVRGKKGDRLIPYKNDFSQVQNLYYIKDKPIVRTEKGFYEINTEADKTIFAPITMPFKNEYLFFDSTQNNYWTQTKRLLLKESVNTPTTPPDTILRETFINQIYQDKQNNIWIATGGMGLYRYSKQDFDRCGSPTLRAVMAITKDKTGATWIGTMNNGLKRIYKGKVDNYPFGSSSDAGGISTIKQNSLGETWVAATNGLNIYDPLTNRFKTFSSQHGLPHGGIGCFDFDEKGGIWAGSRYGVFHFQNGTATESYSTKEKLLGRIIYSIYYHPKSKTVYAGSEFGVSAIKNKKVESILIPEFSNAVILTINPYKEDLLLIGTNGAGACIYNPSNGVRTLINTRNGLPSDLVYFIVADDDESIWIGTEKGINKLLLNERNEIIENINYSRDNGLTGMETNHNAYFLGKEKYFGLVDGLYQFNEISNTSKSYNLLHLTDVQIFYGTYPSRSYATEREGFFQIPKNPIFPSDKNHITFNFNRVDKLFTNSIKYKYYLEGFDKTWSLPSTEHQATYGNLPPSNYIFKIKATNNQGKWDEIPLEYSFIIDAPFYQTVWFKIVAISFIISVIILLIYWRIRSKAMQAIKIEQIRFQEKEILRKDLARDFHDEMGNQLTRIINYVSLLKLNNNHTNGKAELYDKVEASAKILYSGTRDFIWSIDPTNDELVKVFIHIKDFGEQLLKEKNIRFIADNTISGKVHLPYGASREIVLIFKEAITNIFGHSNAKNVELRLKRVDKKFSIQLDDDGIGFESAEVNQPNGLKNMRNRAERMKGILRIRSSSGQGTSVCLIINHHKERYHDFAI